MVYESKIVSSQFILFVAKVIRDLKKGIGYNMLQYVESVVYFKAYGMSGLMLLFYALYTWVPYDG